MEVLEIKNITMNYQDINSEVTAINNVSFTVKEGEFVVIIGPSGCGKSTLLSIICGILKPSSGEVYVDGIKTAGITPKIGYMLQKDNLLEWRTIYDNVMFGLEIKKLWMYIREYQMKLRIIAILNFCIIKKNWNQ